jgi:metal-responsive CopG/Arc/MetJ family transcriptional regulator
MKEHFIASHNTRLGQFDVMKLLITYVKIQKNNCANMLVYLIEFYFTFTNVFLSSLHIHISEKPNIEFCVSTFTFSIA